MIVGSWWPLCLLLARGCIQLWCYAPTAGIGCPGSIKLIPRMQIIKNKYRSQETLKSKDGKLVEKAALTNTPQVYVLKSYPLADSHSIQNELQVYQALKDPHLHGFPQIKEGFQFNARLYIVFEQLGANLEQLRAQCGGRLSLKTTLMLGLQMLDRLEYLHACGFLHGDIKPSNFLLGSTPKLRHKLHMVDFELSHSYLEGDKHIDERQVESFSGSLRFCGIECNQYKNLCRRDEVQSLLFCLIFCLKGELPWMSVKAKNLVEAYELVGAIKKERQAQLLEGLPDSFGKIFHHTLALKFKDKPNYEYVRHELMGLIRKNGYELDYKYDWSYL